MSGISRYLYLVRENMPRRCTLLVARSISSALLHYAQLPMEGLDVHGRMQMLSKHNPFLDRVYTVSIG
jgi:hypothetical protein